MFLSAIRYFKGFVDFYAEGADTESFYSYCSRNGMELFYPRKEGYKLFAKTEAKNYKKLRYQAKKRGIKLKLLKKHGFYFFIKKHKSKVGFVSGIFFIIIFLIFMNQYIWKIEVTGNTKTDKENILSYAKEMGLFTGTYSKKHSVQDIEWYILRENKGLASVEINIQGSVASILVNERAEEPQMVPDDDIPINIVASKYGVIRKMDVFDGQDVVKTGDAVLKGDLLVSAVYEDSHNKLTLKHARAKIMAETDYNIVAEYPLEEKNISKGKLKKKIFEIDFLGKKLLVGNNKGCDNLISEVFSEKLKFFWIELPITLTKTQYFTVKENSITHNFDEGKAGALKLLEQKEKEEMSDMEIISRKTEEMIKDGKYIINADYIVLMDIAEEQPIESNIPWENTDDMS